jgi:CubicO group peptidase (beta-lactamase class C family)
LLSRPLCASGQNSWIDTYARPIETLLEEHFAGSNAGMVIGLVNEHGSRVFSGGKLDNGTERSIDGDTIFELGSVTKVFTALLLLDAVRRGEMNLTDPVAMYLPATVTMPTRAGKQITLQDLAAQDSGLPHHPDNLGDKPLKEMSLKEIKEGSDAYTIEDMYAFLATYRLNQEPGTGFQYSNVGMALLGHAMERRTERGYESLVIERICQPLGMESTLITLTDKDRMRLARGHLADGTPSEHWRLQGMAPAGSLLSTANDMLRFLAANIGLNPTHLTPLMENMQVIRHRRDPVFGRTAMPWVDHDVYNPPGSELLGHSGGGYGTVAFIGIDRKSRRGVAVMTSQMKLHPNPIGWTILQGLPLTGENITSAVREIVGIGVRLDSDQASELLRITGVFPESPASKAGLVKGMAIERINGLSVKGKSVADCLAMMPGPVGTEVRLDIIDSASSETRTVTLAKERFITFSDRSELLAPVIRR